jgi:hypothetical protein
VLVEGEVSAMDALISILFFLGGPMLATVPVTALLCRYRVAHQRRISYGTMFSGACSIPLLWAILLTCIQPDIWWSREHKGTPETLLVMLGFNAAMCVLPALGVVVHFQRKCKRDASIAAQRGVCGPV